MTCINNDNVTDSGNDTCSSYYDKFSATCGLYDTDDFIAARECCVCGGGSTGNWTMGSGGSGRKPVKRSRQGERRWYSSFGSLTTRIRINFFEAVANSAVISSVGTNAFFEEFYYSMDSA